MEKAADMLAQERLTAYLDGELSEAEAIALEDEMQERPELVELLGELRNMRDLLQRVGPEKAPRGFFSRVTDAVDADAASRARRPWWQGMEAALMSIGLAATFLFVMSNAQDDLVSLASAPAAPAAAPAPERLDPREVRLDGATAAEPVKPLPALVNGPVDLAPDGYRLSGPGSLDALRGAVASVGGRMLDASGAPVEKPGPDGMIVVEIDAKKAGAFRKALDGRTQIQSLGMARVVDGAFTLRVFVSE
jgi:anti-sigma factor RsiW